MYSLCFLAIAICSLSTLTHALLLAQRLYQQGVLHVRFLRVVMACVFDPLLPGVCLHASCHTLFLDPIVSFLLSFIYLFLELLYYFHYYLLLRVFRGLKFLAYHTLTLALSYIFVRLSFPWACWLKLRFTINGSTVIYIYIYIYSEYPNHVL